MRSICVACADAAAAAGKVLSQRVQMKSAVDGGAVFAVHCGSAAIVFEAQGTRWRVVNRRRAGACSKMIRCRALRAGDLVHSSRI
jgi:hypothetical protein